MTAVEFLIKELFLKDTIYRYNLKVIEQAKEMEKQQIIDAYKSVYGKNGKTPNMIALGKIFDKQAEQYYNETYGSKGSDECYFEQTTNTSSATICKHCGREKFLHKQ